jgi:hypothetical protein
VASNPPPAELTGLTTKSGKVVVFEPKGAIISRDTLYANTKEGQIVVAVDSIKTLSTKQVSTSRTIGLVLITAVVVYGFVILANKTAGHSYSNPP